VLAHRRKKLNLIFFDRKASFLQPELKGEFMKSKVGLWIDHEKAVIVFVSREANEQSEVSSEITGHSRQSRGAMKADDRRPNQETEHLNKYYDEVVAMIVETELAFLFGPGEAKGELGKRLENAQYKGRVVGVEPADHMTDPQIVAKVRRHYFDHLEANYSAASSQ
jgi:hypothetical protein